MASTAAPAEDWRAVVSRKRRQLDAQLPAAWRLSEAVKTSLLENGRLIAAGAVQKSRLLSEEELDITEHYTARELLDKLARGALSAVAVTTAFSKRAAVAGQLTNCLTECFFDRALDRAEFLDSYLRQNGKPKGPLHGLPVSLKDSFCIEGVATTVGYVSFVDNPPSSHNSALVDMLMDLGAVVYVKTNIPQTLATAETMNNIFGRTLNPHNINLTAGGSSGGEGALMALRGSIMGVGTDLAGSIRVPALCNGVYAFSPTSNRIPWSGQFSGRKRGWPCPTPVAGPLAHSVEDLILFTSTILNAEPHRYDATAPGIPWQQYGAKTKLTIGVLPADEHFPLHPPVRRVMNAATEALKQAGHNIVHLSSAGDRDVAFASRLAWQFFVYGPRNNHISPSGEPFIPSIIKRSNPMFTGPWPVDQDLEPFEKMHRLYHLHLEYLEAWRREWVRNGLDVILAPASQSTAVPHESYGWPPYTVLWNLLDFPSCIIPYGHASKELDSEPMIITDGVQPSYDPEAVDGAPCAVQVVAPHFMDERCLTAASIIDKDIRLTARTDSEPATA